MKKERSNLDLCSGKRRLCGYGSCPRRLDAPENLVQSLRLLLTLPRQGYYPRPVGGVGGCGADLLPDELLALGRRAVCDVPGVLVLGVRTADGSAVFRLWVREEEREVTVAL